MRILLIVDRYHSEVRSAAHLFQDLAEGLHRGGHRVTVLTKMPDAHVPPQLRAGNTSLPAREQVNGVEVMRVRGLFGAGKPLPLRALDEAYVAVRMSGRIARSEHPDAIVAYSPPLPLAAMAVAAAQVRKAPCVLNLHDIYPAMVVEMGMLTNPFAIKAAKMLERFTYRGATRIVVPAKRSLKILTTIGVPRSKVDLVPNWANTTLVQPGAKRNGFRARHALGEGFVASYAGVMGIYQDIGTIIDCARRMRREADVTFVLAGDGVYTEHWKRAAEGLPNVRFIPPLSREDYHELLDASDACFVPLSAELKSPAIPGKIPSIMAAARPIIAIVPLDRDAAEVVYDSHGGLVVPPGDPAMLERTVRWLHQHPELAERLGANGRRYVEQNFNHDQALARFEKLILEAIRQRRRSAA